MNSSSNLLSQTAPTAVAGFPPMVPFSFAPPPPPLTAAGYPRFSPYSYSFPPIYLDKDQSPLVPPLLDLTSGYHPPGPLTVARNNGTAALEEKPSPLAHPGTETTAPVARNGGAPYSPSSSSSDKSSCSHHGLPGVTSEEPSAVLTEIDLWKSFDVANNEMIVTKPGRRLFPTILVTVSGLIPNVQYTVKVRFVSADKYRHKYISGHWTAVCESDIIHDESRMVFVHPSSPCYGDMWIKKPISFKSIKITHHIDSQNGNILLHTMHKYRIEVIVQSHDDYRKEMVFPLTHSEFIAVTSYQSSAITKLKVDNNPFAKGFRDRDSFIPPYVNGYSPFLPPYATSPFHPYPIWTSIASSKPASSLAPLTSIPVPPPVLPSSTTASSSVQPLFSSTTILSQPVSTVPCMFPNTSVSPSLFPVASSTPFIPPLPPLLRTADATPPLVTLVNVPDAGGCGSTPPSDTSAVSADEEEEGQEN